VPSIPGVMLRNPTNTGQRNSDIGCVESVVKWAASNQKNNPKNGS